MQLMTLQLESENSGVIPEMLSYIQHEREAHSTPNIKREYQELYSGISFGFIYLWIIQFIMMLFRPSLLCLVLSVCTITPVLSCRWIKHKFNHHHRVSLDLIEKMVSDPILVCYE